MKYANWNVPERGAEIPRALLAAGCTPLLAAILHLRGLSDPAAARSFLRGGAETLTNPLELTGMVDAVQRLTRAVATGEHVAVYGDYDVDGITAACLLTDYLRFRGLTCELYIPDRIRDGYGLNTAAIDALAEKGVTLIVTVDCGVTNLEETAYAAQRGVDMIVTDHHECREALPEAEAVVDPKQPDSSGVGTALMKTIEQAAENTGARMLILETQSCNENAIAFYKKNGFTIVGFDLYAYSNTDPERHEVRIEMGKKLH